MQQVFDTVGYSGTLGEYFDFYVNNTFYLLSPDYYYQFYSIYLYRCLAAYDGWVNGFHNKQAGLVPQRALQSIARGLNNLLFAHGIDFSTTNDKSYQFAVKWSKESKLYKTLKKAHLFAIAGGTSLVKLNRRGSALYATAHRIDTFFADMDNEGNVVKCVTYFDAIQSTTPNTLHHYGICEERYFNEEGKACVRDCIYEVSSNLQTEVQSRPKPGDMRRVKWDSLPSTVKTYIKKNYPSILLDKEQYLPFCGSLGCFLMRFTDDIPQIPNTQFGQPIGDILFTENFQYDQMKLFEKIEVHLARGRVHVPEELWNHDDPNYGDHALDETYYQKVPTANGDSDKLTPVQFSLRGGDIRTQAENIYKDCAFKLNVSASTIASFLSEGAGAKTATEIIGERTKTDTWIKGQINLNKPEIDELLRTVMLYYGQEPVEVILKAEDQAPFIERLKANSDVFSAGNMTAERFVRDTYKNLTTAEQDREIEALKRAKELREGQQLAMNSYYVKE